MSSTKAGDATKFLAIYLQDHYAGSTGGLEMAKRTAKANGGTRVRRPADAAGDARSPRTATRSSASWTAST